MYNFSDYPTAIAQINGGNDAPHLFGKIKFYQRKDNVLVVANIFNLPSGNRSGFFGFHIHEGDNCEGEGFSNTGSHYSPIKTTHPNHAGDLPPLILCNGGAYMSIITDRFRVQDIIGRTVVIHDSPDDFISQPSGNAGTKIACGVICRG